MAVARRTAAMALAVVSVPLGVAVDATTRPAWAWVDLLCGVVLAATAVVLARRGNDELAVTVALAAVLWFVATAVPALAYAPRAAMAAAVLGAPPALPRSASRRAALGVCVVCAVPWGPATAATLLTSVVIVLARPRSMPGCVLAGCIALAAWARAVWPDRPDLVLLFYSVAFAAVGPLLVQQMTKLRRRAAERVIELGTDADPAEVELALQDAGGDPRLRQEVSEGLRLVAENASLQRDLERQADELVESRRRLITAAERQRRALARRIADGPVMRMASLEGPVADLPHARRLLTGAQCDIDALSRGLLPEAVARGDLETALAELAVGASPPIEVRVSGTRPSGSVAAAAWFVVAEAVANATKHAEAERIIVRCSGDDRWLTVVVGDDGTGGADPSGSGLRGLADRVEALGGTFDVTSGSGRTSVTATIPVTAEQDAP